MKVPVEGLCTECSDAVENSVCRYARNVAVSGTDSGEEVVDIHVVNLVVCRASDSV